jgi:hypothetical protein
MKVNIITHFPLNFTEATWDQKKAMHLSVNIPSGRIVSRVQAELTSVKMCSYESEQPSLNFEFGEASNDTNPLESTVLLSNNCECNICPVNQEALDWSATHKQWNGSKEFVLDIHFEGSNSTVCVKTLTIKIHFASESSRSFFIHLQEMKDQKFQRSQKSYHLPTMITPS